MEDDSYVIDPALSAVQEIIQSLTQFQHSLVEEDLLAMRISRINLSTPIELDVYKNEAGELILGSAPPIYSVPTTDMPVFHQLKLTIERTDG